MKSVIYSDSGAMTAERGRIKAMEVTPDGGELEIRILRGTDNSGTELYRLRALEGSVYRDFRDGLEYYGDLYLYFYEGSGVVITMY